MAFVQDFDIVEAPFDSVRGRIGSGASELIAAALDDTRVHGENTLARVKPRAWPALLAKTVEVRCAPSRTHGDALVVSFAWAAASGVSLFPELEADLEFSPFGDTSTRVLLRGNYEPPGGVVGRGLDQLVLHRIAESTIRALLGSLCELLAENSKETSTVPT